MTNMPANRRRTHGSPCNASRMCINLFRTREDSAKQRCWVLFMGSWIEERRRKRKVLFLLRRKADKTHFLNATQCGFRWYRYKLSRVNYRVGGLNANWPKIVAKANFPAPLTVSNNTDASFDSIFSGESISYSLYFAIFWFFTHLTLSFSLVLATLAGISLTKLILMISTLCTTFFREPLQTTWKFKSAVEEFLSLNF